MPETAYVKSAEKKIKVISHTIRLRNKRLLAAHRAKKDLHVFCVSRKKYDRLVSVYHSLLDDGRNRLDLYNGELFVNSYNDFKDFVSAGDFFHVAYCFNLLISNNFQTALKDALKVASFTCQFTATLNWLNFSE